MLSEDTLMRLCIFVSVLVLIVIWERLAPCRRHSASIVQRWFSNLGISLINRLLLSALPLSLLAAWAADSDQNLGLFNLVDTPEWVALVGSIVLLDLVVYAQHRLFHRVPILWRC